MTGVEILNITYKYASLINVCWLLLCLCLMLLIAIAGMITIDYDIIQKILIRCEIFMALITIVCFIGVLIKTDEIIDTEYDVVISDEVSMNEFTEKYEIIEQNGKIYTVKERD